MIIVDIGGHELEFDIPDNAIVTGAVGVINYQILGDDGIPRAASYVTNSSIARPTAMGMYILGLDWTRDNANYQDEDEDND